MKQDKTDKIICPDRTSFLQFVSDDTDGQNTHHGLGTIATANGKFSNYSIQWQKIPRDKLEKWLDTNPTMESKLSTIKLPTSQH